MNNSLSIDVMGRGQIGFVGASVDVKRGGGFGNLIETPSLLKQPANILRGKKTNLESLGV